MDCRWSIGRSRPSFRQTHAPANDETRVQPDDHAHISTEADLDAGIAALIGARPSRWEAVHRCVKRTARRLRRREGGYAGLAQIIVSQQVSVASAAAIYGRLAAACTPLDAPERAARQRKDQACCGSACRRPRSRHCGRSQKRSRESTSTSMRLPTSRPTTHMRRWCSCMASALGPPISICWRASATRTPGRPATLRCRKRRAWPSTCRTGRRRKKWGRLPTAGGRIVWCSGATVVVLLSGDQAAVKGCSCNDTDTRQQRRRNQSRVKRNEEDNECPLNSTARGLRPESGRQRASSSCSCTATVPTAMI